MREDNRESKEAPEVAAPVHKKVLRSRTFQFSVVAIVTALSLYSGYVIRHHPDSQGTIVLGQTRLSADCATAPRILITDCTTSSPIAGAEVRLAIEGQGISHDLGKFITGEHGSLSDRARIPDVSPGKYNLIIDGQSRAGKDHIVRPITVERACQMYLTTDKSVYQPGQTIHMRALVLNEISLKPCARQPILFEIQDSKGNKVFKSNLASSDFGIVSCDFELAPEVNLGQYQILTSAGETLDVAILSTSHSGTVFLDIIRNGQTVLTEMASIDIGLAEFAIDLSGDLCGTLELNAYVLASGRSAIMDSRLIYVRRANQLGIAPSLYKAVHKPGEVATINLSVTNSSGRPAPAALSLAAVDEAVFYVCENRHGRMEQFFPADRELLRSAYELAFAVPLGKLLSGREEYQNLARALFCPEAQMIDWDELMWVPDHDDIPGFPSVDERQQ